MGPVEGQVVLGTQGNLGEWESGGRIGIIWCMCLDMLSLKKKKNCGSQYHIFVVSGDLISALNLFLSIVNLNFIGFLFLCLICKFVLIL